MCYVFSYLCVPLIGSDHVVNKSHVCKELMFFGHGLVWKKAHGRFLAIALYPVSKYLIVGLSIEFTCLLYEK